MATERGIKILDSCRPHVGKHGTPVWLINQCNRHSKLWIGSFMSESNVCQHFLTIFRILGEISSGQFAFLHCRTGCFLFVGFQRNGIVSEWMRMFGLMKGSSKQHFQAVFIRKTLRFMVQQILFGSTGSFLDTSITFVGLWSCCSRNSHQGSHHFLTPRTPSVGSRTRTPTDTLHA